MVKQQVSGWRRACCLGASGGRADLDRLAGVAEVLSDFDRQVADLQNRVTALLDGQII